MERGDEPFLAFLYTIIKLCLLLLEPRHMLCCSRCFPMQIIGPYALYIMRQCETCKATSQQVHCAHNSRDGVSRKLIWLGNCTYTSPRRRRHYIPYSGDNTQQLRLKTCYFFFIARLFSLAPAVAATSLPRQLCAASVANTRCSSTECKFSSQTYLRATCDFVGNLMTGKLGIARLANCAISIPSHQRRFKTRHRSFNCYLLLRRWVQLLLVVAARSVNTTN